MLPRGRFQEGPVRCGRPFAAVATGGKEHLESPGGFIRRRHPSLWMGTRRGVPTAGGSEAYLARTPQRRTHRDDGYPARQRSRWAFFSSLLCPAVEPVAGGQVFPGDFRGLFRGNRLA